MKSGITLKIKATDAAGKVFHEECRENDLFLWNWGVFWAQFFKVQFNYTDPTTFAWKDLNGAERVTSAGNLYGWYDASPDIWYGLNEGRVRVGSGNTAPTISDYALQSEVAAVVPNPPVVVTSGNIIKVLFTATFTFQMEKTCGEVGVSVSDFLDGSNAMLITRDIYTPVTVPAGGALALQYELWFNGTPT